MNNDWTYTSLFVSPQDGSDDAIHELDSFESDMEDPDDNSPLSFYESLPIPEVLVESFGDDSEECKNKNYAKTGFKSLFEYTKKRWGSPYDPVDVSLEYMERHSDNETLKYEFRTQDGHCLPWLAEVSSQYPSLVFEITCQNELDLFDSFDAVYINGKQVSFNTHKN